MSIVLTFRIGDETDVLGSFDTYEEALEEAKNQLINLNTDEEVLAEVVGEDWTWKQAVEQGCDLTNGDEEFKFTETA